MWPKTYLTDTTESKNHYIKYLPNGNKDNSFPIFKKRTENDGHLDEEILLEDLQHLL